MSLAERIMFPYTSDYDTGSRVTEEIAAAANQTFRRGALLVLSADRVTKAGTDPTPIFGIAAEAATAAGTIQGSTDYADPLWEVDTTVAGSVGRRLIVHKLTDGRLFLATMQGTLALADKGAEFGVTADAAEATNGVWYVDKAKTGGAARVRVVDWPLESTIGGTFQRIIVRFLPAHIQG